MTYRSSLERMKLPRCLWPSCHLPVSGGYVYCSAHHQALGPDLQRRLRAAHGTEDWIAALDACQAHAKQTVEWVRRTFHGGGTHVDSDAKGG